VVVVLPTPPFWLAMQKMVAINCAQVNQFVEQFGAVSGFSSTLFGQGQLETKTHQK
jgi:hypothetical protein